MLRLLPVPSEPFRSLNRDSALTSFPRVSVARLRWEVGLGVQAEPLLHASHPGVAPAPVPSGLSHPGTVSCCLGDSQAASPTRRHLGEDPAVALLTPLPSPPSSGISRRWESGFGPRVAGSLRFCSVPSTRSTRNSLRVSCASEVTASHVCTALSRSFPCPIHGGFYEAGRQEESPTPTSPRGHSPAIHQRMKEHFHRNAPPLQEGHTG